VYFLVCCFWRTIFLNYINCNTDIYEFAGFVLVDKPKRVDFTKLGIRQLWNEGIPSFESEWECMRVYVRESDLRESIARVSHANIFQAGVQRRIIGAILYKKNNYLRSLLLNASFACESATAIAVKNKLCSYVQPNKLRKY
jgi:hypothetical protein